MKAKNKNCSYCGVKMVFMRGQPHSATTDHVIPKSSGGQYTTKCCNSCNQDKADLLPSEFIQILRNKSDYRLETVINFFEAMPFEVINMILQYDQNLSCIGINLKSLTNKNHHHVTIVAQIIGQQFYGKPHSALLTKNQRRGVIRTAELIVNELNKIN